jgi:two-component system nitrogen regulation response regulator GlnG
MAPGKRPLLTTVDTTRIEYTESMSDFARQSTRSQIRTGERTAPLREIPALTLVAHPEAQRVGERVALPALVSGRPLALSRLAPDFGLVDSTGQSDNVRPRPLEDPWISRRPLLLSPEATAGSLRLDRGGSATTLCVDGEPLSAPDASVVLSADRVRRGVSLLLAHRVVVLLHVVRFLPPPRVPRFDLVGESDSMLALRREIERVAPLELPVLLRGATGTGKELLAAALHRASGRRDGPFLALNMAAIPPTLAASELFGAARGAFTGATEAQAGHFRRCHGGTLFLDEIGETPEEVQVLLLRALETGEVQPLGGSRPVATDVRLVAATDADLEDAMQSGTFRAALLHRLAGYTLQVPSLAERREDIGRLFHHFVRQGLADLGGVNRLAASANAEQPWLPAEVMDVVVRAPWPGNVRQLRNAARRIAIAHHDEDQVSLATLAAILTDLPAGHAMPESASAIAIPKKRRPSEISGPELRAALLHHRFNLRAVAKAFGISRTSLYTRIEASGTLRKATDLDRAEIEAALEAAGGDADEAALQLEVSHQALKRRMAQLGPR